MKLRERLAVADRDRPFPGLLGRGLIEAPPDIGRHGLLVQLSPVYWAGASLKLGEPVVEDGRVVGHLSPVYWAGASLKPGGQLQGRPSLGGFPRSTGPGPH